MTWEVTVPTGSPDEVLAAALKELPRLPEGRYTISIDWPREP